MSQAWSWNRRAALVLILALIAMDVACGGFPRRIVLPIVSGLVLRPPSDRDAFFNIVAADFKRPDLCNRIAWRADASITAWDSPYTIRTLRSKCLDNLALPPNQSVSETPFWMPEFAAQVRALGYTDADLMQATWAAHYQATPVYTVYKDLLANNEFRSRLRAASDSGESRDRTRLRPARPIEFLYQMVAVDAPEAALCSKISPNATFIDLGDAIALLQSRCYLSIAFNTRDIRVCEPLPAAGSFPHINEPYDSRESCQKTVAIYNRPDFKGDSSYGSAPFPRASDLQAILGEIGYQTDALTKVPEPTADEYWEFVSRLIFRGSANDRAEFLRRVEALE